MLAAVSEGIIPSGDDGSYRRRAERSERRLWRQQRSNRKAESAVDGQQYFVKQFGQVDEIVTFEYSSAVNPADYRTPGQYLKALLDALDTRSTALRALVQQWRDEADLLDADAEGMAVDSSLPVAGALTGEAEQLRACADQLAALLED